MSRETVVPPEAISPKGDMASHFLKDSALSESLMVSGAPETHPLIVAKITPNDTWLDHMNDDELTVKNLTNILSKLTYAAEPHRPAHETNGNKVIEFVKISNDNCMSDIVSIIENYPFIANTDDIPVTKSESDATVTRNNVYNTYKCYEASDCMIYLLYSTIKDKTQNNALCRYFSEGFEEVYGNCVLLKTCYNSEGKSINCDITMKDVVNGLISKIIHTAVWITPDGNLRNVNFTNIPIENTPITEANCRSINIEFLGKDLIMFIEPSPQDTNINTYATIIGKKQKILGNVVVTLMSHVPTCETTNVDDELMHKILVVMSNHSICREIKFDNDFDTNKFNFYKLIDKYYDMCSGRICEIIPPDVLNGYTYNSTLS